MKEMGPESGCEICGGPHPTGECQEQPTVVKIGYGQGEASDFKEGDSSEVFRLALEQSLKRRGIEFIPQGGEAGLSVYDVTEAGNIIGQIEIAHAPTTREPGWAKAFTVTFAGFDGEGLSRHTVGKPEDLDALLDQGMQDIREYQKKFGGEE